MSNNYTTKNPYEGAYHIDNNLIYVLTDNQDGTCSFNEEATEQNLKSILTTLQNLLSKKFPSFKPVNMKKETKTHIILQNGLFMIGIIPNANSITVALLQKPDKKLLSLQKGNYQPFMKGLAEALLELVPEIQIQRSSYKMDVLTKGDI